MKGDKATVFDRLQALSQGFDVAAKPRKSCFWGHEWTRWKAYASHYGLIVAGKVHEAVDTRQWRQCAVCGKVQDERVAEMTKSPATARADPK